MTRRNPWLDKKSRASMLFGIKLAARKRQLARMEEEMEKQQEGDRWHKLTPASRKPKAGLGVLVVIRVGFDQLQVLHAAWNEQRNLWFSGERPVYPLYWRPMPRPPKERRYGQVRSGSRDIKSPA